MKWKARFLDTYGPLAIVAGASEGLGAAFAEALAEIGLDLVLIARRSTVLDAVAARLQAAYDVSVRCIAGDLASPATIDLVAHAAENLDAGLIVYNAAFAPLGPFADTPPDRLFQVVDINVHAPVALVRRMLPGLRRRGHGGVVLMSSLAGEQGSPGIAAYAASKAFNTALAQGLWRELRPDGIDVVACVAGAVRTPGLKAATGRTAAHEAPGTLDPAAVARAALRGLGKRPIVVPGLVNRVARIVMRRLLPLRAAIAIMESSARGLGG